LLQITATLDFDPYSHDFDPTNSLSLKGSMDLMVGNNIMSFAAPEHDGLAIQCIFDGHDDYSCAGTILYESSQQTCAEFVLERKGKNRNNINRNMNKYPNICLHQITLISAEMEKTKH
jgi:hypothetical protein